MLSKLFYHLICKSIQKGKENREKMEIANIKQKRTSGQFRHYLYSTGARLWTGHIIGNDWPISPFWKK